MKICRRGILGAATSGLIFPQIALAAAGQAARAGSGTRPFAPVKGPRSRVLYVNDLSGDIDGLFATVHMLLSRSIEVRGIVGTSTGRPRETAVRSAEFAAEILQTMGLTGTVPVHAGAPGKLAAAKTPVDNPGTRAIIAEAMREDTKLPLFVTVGGGLTEVASAVMLEPRIASRMTLVWIGGDAYPAGGTGETNFNIDSLAAQYLFNETGLRIWQVPRSVYKTCLVSATELQAFVAPYGKIGQWLYRQVEVPSGTYTPVLNTGETWTLGDNPLVALTALTGWGPDVYRPSFRYERTDSSSYDEVIAPTLNPDGTFAPRREGRPIRIYTSIDNRTMMNDFFAKMRINYG